MNNPFTKDTAISKIKTKIGGKKKVTEDDINLNRLLINVESSSKLKETITLPESEEIFKESLPYTNKLSAIIIEGIHRNKRALSQWERIRKSSNSIVTFDLYSMGILLFDAEYTKQHYTLNYK